MKLCRIGHPGRERPAALDADGRLRDLSLVTDDIHGRFLEALTAGVLSVHLDRLPVIDGGERYGAPLARPGKVVCIGLNYRDHAAETGAAIPDEPVVFFKAPSVVVGPDDEVRIPRGSTKTDYEVELGVVIGRTARYLASRDEARDVIAGYAISHDVSERDFQLHRGGQWDKGKSCETFNPLGPWVVTADEVEDPQALALSLRVNGEVRQDSTTAEMIFDVLELVRYLSQFMVLEPGDLINTGTPGGVALASGEGYLAPGDTVTLTVAGLGRQEQKLAAAP